jgi:hypothetical protein
MPARGTMAKQGKISSDLIFRAFADSFIIRHHKEPLTTKEVRKLFAQIYKLGRIALPEICKQ